MPQVIRGNILVLDDDAAFRALVRSILEARGFQVVEASTPSEASTHLASRTTVLAIVDYRLPQVDGMTWITKLRESGVNTPVVFCSAIPCDMKTFNWLRNVLRVSLILQKPIIPSSFVEQIESLLPGYEKVYPQEVGISSSVSYEQISDNSASEEMIAEMAKAKRKLEMEKAIHNAKVEYIGELDGQWRTLTGLLDIHNNDKSRRDVLIEARHIAHKIRGTAGSVGLPQVSEIAAKLEDFLLGLDGQEDTQQEVIWSEIIRVLAMGHQTVAVTLTAVGSSSESLDRPNVLVVSAFDDVLYASSADSIRQIANVEVTSNPTGVANIFAKHRIDAVLLEMTADRQLSMQRASEIRRLPGGGALPLGLLTTPEAPLSSVEQLYVGGSINLVHPIAEESLGEGIAHLLTMKNPDQPKVLAIDDDDVLCRFVASVLRSERMDVMTATNPLTGLELIDKYGPDLILLDVMMPVMTGFEVCRRIRENKDWQNIPVVFLTSKTSADARSAAFAVGANDFVTKPVIAAELIKRIHSQLYETSMKRQMKSRDSETGVLNGDFVMELANLMLVKHEQYEAPMAVALLSINDYDQLTLVQGHYSARQAAKCLGELLQLRFRGEDLRGRWSDHGYVLIVDQCDREVVEEALQLLHEDFSNIQFSGSAFRFTSTFSYGVADSYLDGEKLEGLIRVAHSRMKASIRSRESAISAAEKD